MAKKETIFNKEHRATTLGKKIKTYLSETGSTQADFAQKIDEELGLAQDKNYSLNAKKVSNWVRGEVFPDIPYLIAISLVMNTTIDELLVESIQEQSKTSSLSNSARQMLKLLLQEKMESRDEENKPCYISSLYLPYSFNGEALPAYDKVFTRKEVIDIYKERATLANSVTQLNYFYEILKEKGFETMQPYFSKFCGLCYVIETDGNPERISFDNSHECYKQLQEVWTKAGHKDFYNVLYFSEIEVNKTYDEYEAYSMVEAGKDAFYKLQADMEKTYKNAFEELLDKKIIVPQKEDNLYEDGALIFEMDRDKNFAYFVDINGDVSAEYQLETLKFNFYINLSNAQIKQFYQEEINENFVEKT